MTGRFDRLLRRGPRRRSQDARPRLVILASTTYAGHQLYDQRLARALADVYDVVYVEPALPVVRVGRRRSAATDRVQFRRRQDGIEIVIPRMLPFGRRPPLAPATGLLVGLQLAWYLARRPVARPDKLVITACHPATLRVIRAHRAVLLVKDDYIAGASLVGEDADRLRDRRAALVAAADEVVVVSPRLERDLREAGSSRVHVIPAGCDPVRSWEVAEPAELHAIARPRALFSGLLSDRIDFDAIMALAAAGTRVVMVGGVQRMFSGQDRLARAEATGTVVALPPRDQDALQAVALWCDVGLVPYADSPFNRASFPLKTLEYLAAGLPVVSSPLESVVWLDEPEIRIAADPAEFAAAVQGLPHVSDAQRRERAAQVVARHSWASRAARWHEVLDTGA